MKQRLGIAQAIMENPDNPARLTAVVLYVILH